MFFRKNPDAGRGACPPKTFGSTDEEDEEETTESSCDEEDEEDEEEPSPEPSQETTEPSQESDPDGFDQLIAELELTGVSATKKCTIDIIVDHHDGSFGPTDLGTGVGRSSRASRPSLRSPLQSIARTRRQQRQHGRGKRVSDG